MDSLSILRSIFNYAADEKNLAVANITGISIKASHTNMRVLSVSEQEKLEIALREDLNPCNLGILLCLYTGIRIGELCALTWNDIIVVCQCGTVVCEWLEPVGIVGGPHL